MKIIKYYRCEFHRSPQKVKAYLYQFLLDIPYFLYFGVIPSIEVINEVLKTGGFDGGMGPGAKWEPFEIDKTEYDEIINKWKTMNIQEELNNRNIRYNPQMIIDDNEIIQEKKHLKYLRKSLLKYKELYAK